jgi:hypothetical protein
MENYMNFKQLFATVVDWMLFWRPFHSLSDGRQRVRSFAGLFDNGVDSTDYSAPENQLSFLLAKMDSLQSKSSFSRTDKSTAIYDGQNSRQDKQNISAISSIVRHDLSIVWQTVSSVSPGEWKDNDEISPRYLFKYCLQETWIRILWDHHLFLEKSVGKLPPFVCEGTNS